MRRYPAADLAAQTTPCAGAGHDPVPGAGGPHGACPVCRAPADIDGDQLVAPHVEPFRLIVHRADPDGPAGATLRPAHPTHLPAIAPHTAELLAWQDPRGVALVTWHGGRRHRATTHQLRPRALRRLAEHLQFTETATRPDDVVQLVPARVAWQLPRRVRVG